LKKRILFVCSGNTCRSPMAEALAREIIRRQYGGAIDVCSAGVFALPGARATPEAVEALAEAGIDLKGHRAALLSTALVEEADLVLTMTAMHRHQILQLASDSGHKVHVLADYAGWGGDLEDPIGRPLAVYRDCASRLRTLVTAALARFARTGPAGES